MMKKLLLGTVNALLLLTVAKSFGWLAWTWLEIVWRGPVLGLVVPAIIFVVLFIPMVAAQLMGIKFSFPKEG